MKRIIFGLAVLSTFCFATGASSNKPEVSGEGSNYGLVFKPTAEHQGKIEITGSLTGKVAEVKYVVYTSTRG